MKPSVPHRIAALRRPGLHAWIDGASPYAAELERRIDEIAAVPATFTPVPTHNRMNRVWEGRLEGIPGTFILKLGWCNPVYSLGRRISRRVDMAFRNRFLQSMELSFRLEAMDFASIRPVLCWERKEGLFPSEIGILYPKLEAGDSLGRYLKSTERRRHFTDFPRETALAWGRHTRKLHQAGLLHVDPAPQNILLRLGAGEPPGEEDFLYIDAEAFRVLRCAPGSPWGRYARARSMIRALVRFESADLLAFCEGFALPGESAGAWVRLFEWFRRHPHLHLPGKAMLLWKALRFRDGGE